MTREVNKVNSLTTSNVKQHCGKQNGRIKGMQSKMIFESIKDTSIELSSTNKHFSNNCAICRTEYLLVDFKSSQICDECVQYIKDNC